MKNLQNGLTIEYKTAVTTIKQNIIKRRKIDK